MAQHWGMLLFESMSAGVLAIFVGFVAVLVVVSVYVILVWPITFWDLANLGLERFEAWVRPCLWLVFCAGSVGGYFCFSGTIFKRQPRVPVGAGSVRGRR